MPVPRVGPKEDTEFFEEVEALFKKHAEVSKKYSVRYIGAEVDALKLDFTKTVAVSRLEGKQLITDFVDRATVIKDKSGGGSDEEEMLEANRFCCEWVHTGTRMRCVKICS
ncbi:hypothetical protein [Streptomyces sp. H27-H5]|uniref:hypothetical protein n=1 Tax=Streptomyces sp. H27-H5 TaxID=2996460 RepID=UPI00226EF9F7|nr:hypothetical protein [Streptomyces sp. H27-H5]MCY0958484.1 hypothetical protein [Streptomyces sp. H27-H5]